MKRVPLIVLALLLLLPTLPVTAQVNIYRCGGEFLRMRDTDAQAQKCTIAAGASVAVLEAGSKPLGTIDKYIDSLTGAALVAVAGAFIAYGFDRRKKYEARKEVEIQLCHALRGELRSLRGQLRFFLGIAAQAKQNFMAASNEQEYRMGLHQLALCKQLDTRIFDANVQQVGALWQLMTREISEFYGDVKGLGLIGTALGTTSASGVGHQLDWFLYECQRLNQETIRLVARLKIQTEGTYPEPAKKYLKAGGVFEDWWKTNIIIQPDNTLAEK